MTDEERMVLAELKNREMIIASNYWENFKFAKDLSQGMGGNHPKVKRMVEECDEIRKDWNAVENSIKEFLKTIKRDKDGDD
jgi:hypothetical protein